MLITRKLLRAWDACYGDARIAALVPPEGLTPLQVLDTEIPLADRLWVVLREEIIPERELRLLAVRWARGALEAERAAGREPDARSWAACDVAERYARGEASAEELAASRGAAWDAAGAAYNAAWAARDAARDATYAAARAAARAATRAAAYAAARDAAYAAAWDAQIEDVRAVLRGLEGAND